MKVLNTRSQLSDFVNIQRRQGDPGLRIGFVPTMGFLHQGHLSLLQLARNQCQTSIVSIFVNPTQFNDPQDLDNYPQDLDNDLKLLHQQGADAVYIPDQHEIYPGGEKNNRIWLMAHELDEHLCGRSRPGHFRGVLTVVAKLLHQAQPDFAYFGKKDWQQGILIKEMVESLFFPVQVVLGDIIRESDGLAMSSRNANLSPFERRQAPALYQCLLQIRASFQKGEHNSQALIIEAKNNLNKLEHTRIDYVEIVDKYSLQPFVGSVQSGRALLALAVFFGSVRLIDNIEL